MQTGDRERRAERDALIRELRAERWTLRAIGAHPDVRLSAVMVGKVLAHSVTPDNGDGLNDLDRWRLKYASANTPAPDLYDWPDDDTGDYDAGLPPARRKRA